MVKRQVKDNSGRSILNNENRADFFSNSFADNHTTLHKLTNKLDQIQTENVIS